MLNILHYACIGVYCITSGSIPYLWGAHLYNFDPPSEILDLPLDHGSNDIMEKNATKNQQLRKVRRKKGRNKSQGQIQDFMRGGAKYNTGSLKQGVWGAVPPEAIGFLFFKYKTYQMQNSHTV